MGRIKTTFIKNVGRELYEKHGDKFTTDFSKNKQVLKQLAEIKSKKLMNTIAGYITSLKNQHS
jgi:small subunit ribosomal protein S17e